MSISEAAARVIDEHAGEVRLLLDGSGSAADRKRALLALLAASWHEGWDAYGDQVVAHLAGLTAPRGPIQ